MMLNNDPSNNVDYRNDFLSYATRLSLAKCYSTYFRRQQIIESYFVIDAGGLVEQQQ